MKNKTRLIFWIVSILVIGLAITFVILKIWDSTNVTPTQNTNNQATINNTQTSYPTTQNSNTNTNNQGSNSNNQNNAVDNTGTDNLLTEGKYTFPTFFTIQYPNDKIGIDNSQVTSTGGCINLVFKNYSNVTFEMGPGDYPRTQGEGLPGTLCQPIGTGGEVTTETYQFTIQDKTYTGKKLSNQTNALYLLSMQHTNGYYIDVSLGVPNSESSIILPIFNQILNSLEWVK